MEIEVFFDLQEEEAYVCIYSHRKGDTILFHHQGGVDVGDVDAKALKLEVPVGADIPSSSELTEKLLVNVADDKKPYVESNQIIRRQKQNKKIG